MQGIRLCSETLSDLDSRVHRPFYDPGAVTPGVVHLGYGGFHRAHMARYTHDLMQAAPDNLSWGIVGAGLLPADRRLFEALRPQNWLYTLIERDRSAETVSVIGATDRLVDTAEGTTGLLQAMEAPDIRIVSLTVTGNGYGLNPSSNRLDLAHPQIAADLLSRHAPRSAVGVIVEAYRRRRDAGGRAFTALSCDNIQHNGQVLKQAVLDLAAAQDLSLAGWIEREARFPSSMVDRITPATRPEDAADLADRYGVVDAWPVFSERFSQWVIEDDFSDGRPDWDRAGAQFVQDVSPYELMKLRLLNTSHLAIAGLGRLAGLTFVDEVLSDDRFRRYMRGLMDLETGPTLQPVPGVDLEAYKTTLIDRFANPDLRDTVDRINADAPLNYLLDPIRERLKRRQSIELLALALAAWLRRVRGVDDAGAPIEVRHPLAERLRREAMRGGEDPRALLQIEPLFGDLGASPELVTTTAFWLGSLYQKGASRTLDDALARHVPGLAGST